MISFDTSILVNATSSLPDEKSALARNVIERAMRIGSGILLLQPLTEYCDLARKVGISTVTIENMMQAWTAVLPVFAPDEDDFQTAVRSLGSFENFRDALLCASAKRAGVKHFLSERLLNGFDFRGVAVVNPFYRPNDGLMNRILRPTRRRRKS